MDLEAPDSRAVEPASALAGALLGEGGWYADFQAGALLGDGGWYADFPAGALLGEGSWYADFQAGADHVVVCAGKVFRYRRGDHQGRAEVIRYGRSMGVPEHQLDCGDLIRRR